MRSNYAERKRITDIITIGIVFSELKCCKLFVAFYKIVVGIYNLTIQRYRKVNVSTVAHFLG